MPSQEAEQYSEWRREYESTPEAIAVRSARELTPRGKAAYLDIVAHPRSRAIVAAEKRQRKYNARPEVKAKRAVYRSERYANDPVFKLALLLRTRLRSAIKNRSKSGSAVDLLGCTIPELITHFETLFTTGMTWDNHGKWHIDHIQPLASFNLEDPQQLAIACHYSNLQPLWAADNMSKGAKILAA